MQNADFHNIIKLTQQKHDLMEEFLALSHKQAEAIDQDDDELVSAIISQKQNIIEKVDLLNLELPDQIPENNDWLQTINKKTKEIIIKAAALERKNIQLLKSNQNQVYTEIINIQKSKKTHAQYRGDNMKMEGMLLDIKK